MSTSRIGVAFALRILGSCGTTVSKSSTRRQKSRESEGLPRGQAEWVGPAAPPNERREVLVNTGDLKRGFVIELDKELWTVLEFQHLKLGRGSAQVRMKLRNIR
ncbi:MAG: hypothetical protein ACYDAG_10090, partial [Chloroflexota bacterium]